MCDPRSPWAMGLIHTYTYHCHNIVHGLSATELDDTHTRAQFWGQQYSQFTDCTMRLAINDLCNVVLLCNLHRIWVELDSYDFFEGPTCAQTQIHLKPIPILPYLVLGQFALKVGYVGLHPEGTFSCTNVIALMGLRSSSFLNLNLGAIYKRIIIEILQQQDVIMVDAVC